MQGCVERKFSIVVLMSGQQCKLEGVGFIKTLIRFDGSSPNDIPYAKLLWNSLSLLPPLESRLVSSDICQRLPVAHERTTIPKTPSSYPSKYYPFLQPLEERKRYLALASQRDSIQTLLKKQKDARIKKEQVSRPYKPKPRSQSQGHNLTDHNPSIVLEMDIALVKLLPD